MCGLIERVLRKKLFVCAILKARQEVHRRLYSLNIKGHIESIQRVLMLGGSAGLITTLFILVDGYDGLGILFGSIEALRLFIASAAGSAVIVCVVFALYSILTNRSWTLLFSVGCFFAFPGLVMAFFSVSQGLPDIVLVLAGALFGSGLCFLCGRWLLVLGRCEEKSLLGNLAISLILAALFKAFALSLTAWVSFTLFLTLAVMVASLVVFIRFEVSTPPQAEGNELVVNDLKAMFRLNGVLLVGLLLCVYVIASAWSAVFEGSSMASNPQIEGIWGSIVGSLVAGLTFMAVRKKSGHSFLERLSQVLPLVCVTTMLLAWFLGSWDSELGRFLSNIPIGFSIASLGVLLCLQMRQELWRALPTTLVFSMNALVVVGFLVLVMLLWPFVGDTVAQSIHLSLMVLYLLTVAVLSITKNNPRTNHIQIDDQEVLNATSQMRERYGLSAREVEILEFLIQGRSAPYISKELYVSINTIKTHMKRIYQKVDVHSREELLDVYYVVADEKSS